MMSSDLKFTSETMDEHMQAAIAEARLGPHEAGPARPEGAHEAPLNPL